MAAQCDAVTEPRYQIFVSSTYTDLVEERQAAISALLQLGAMPAGMELFPAANDEAWALIQRVIDESDYYLLIVGGRYGSLTTEGLSFTEKEYDYAQNRGKPVMAFLHGSPGTIALEKSEIEPQARVLLEAFRTKVEAQKHVKYWTSAEDLAGKIALSYTSFVRTYPATGWIKADAGDSPVTLKRLAEAQDQIRELEGLISAQGEHPPEGSQGLADNDERVDLTARTQIEIRNLNSQTSNISARQTFAADCSISWNEALFELGPMLLNEASEGALEKRFTTAVATLQVDQLVDEAREWLSDVPANEIEGWSAGKKRPELDIRVISAVVDTSDFETVLLQLQALGVIQQSERKRQVSDRNTYWTLTPWGRTRLTRLRAVRAGETRPPEPEFESTSSQIAQTTLATDSNVGPSPSVAPASGEPADR